MSLSFLCFNVITLAYNDIIIMPFQDDQNNHKQFVLTGLKHAKPETAMRLTLCHAHQICFRKLYSFFLCFFVILSRRDNIRGVIMRKDKTVISVSVKSTMNLFSLYCLHDDLHEDFLLLLSCSVLIWRLIFEEMYNLFSRYHLVIVFKYSKKREVQ